MWAEEDYVLLSWLQHYGYCSRRAALVVLEQSWADNVYTAEGAEVHERVDQLRRESRVQTVYASGLPLVSERYGLVGRADLVEYQQRSDASLSLPGKAGFWTPIPVDYKRGRQRVSAEYALQVCGQALCLEEMLGVPVRDGAIYYAASHKRVSFPIDDTLRSQTLRAVDGLRSMLRSQTTPTPSKGPRCKGCSLSDLCMPGLARARSAEGYLKAVVEQALKEKRGTEEL